MADLRLIENRLMSKVVWNGDEDECWEWEGYRSTSGYGRFRNGQDVEISAHRASWEVFSGPIPDGLHVLHKCDNPPCVNPAHLFLGTQADNMADMARKGRGRNGGRKGTRNGRAVLTDKEVAEVRRRYQGRRGEQTALAREFGVGQVAIYRIVRGLSWVGQ